MAVQVFHRPAVRAGVPRGLRGFIGALVVALGFVALPPATQANAQSSDVVKVYVVRSPGQNGGVADTLPEIAQRTLGTSSRAAEIFTLNKGRTQPDGSALTSQDQPLHPGWILRLPSDASGPFVQFGRLGDGSTAAVTVPVALAVAAGVLLIGLTLLLLLRRQTAALARRIGRLFRWLTGPARTGRALRIRRRLASRWRIDNGIRAAARASLAEAALAAPAMTPGPVAVELGESGVSVLPAVVVPRGGACAHPRRAADGVPVLVGGRENSAIFVDLTWCDGVLALSGHARTASELLGALVTEIGQHFPGLRISYFGQPPAGARGVANSAQLASLIGPQPGRRSDAPVLAAASRRFITDVIAVPATTPPIQSAEIARLCSGRASTWTAIIAQDVPGAHWRWDAHRDGTMCVPLLGATIIAAR